MRDLFPLCTMEQISQIHYAEHFPFSFHSSVNGVIFDKIYRKLIGKNTLDRFFIRIFALFGYKYLVCAIVISMQDSYLLNGVTTKLCPEIARRYGVNPRQHRAEHTHRYIRNMVRQRPSAPARSYGAQLSVSAGQRKVYRHSKPPFFPVPPRRDAQ